MDWLIDEITNAAFEAIELAASEAARAAMLASLDREAVLLREVQRLRVEAGKMQEAVNETKFIGKKNTMIGFFCGIVLGAAASFLISN